MNLKKILSLSLALVVLATVAVLTGTGTVGASPHINSVIAAPPPASIAVNVTNTPLPVTGSVSASITNAALPVTGTVAVSSLPAVTLSGTSAVSLSNNQFTPVVVEPDAAATVNPYGSVCAFNGPISAFQGGANDCTSFMPVAQGTRLVIEQLSFSARVPSGTVVSNAYFGVNEGVGGTVPDEFLVFTKVASDSISDYYAASTPVRAYATFAPAYPLGGLSCGIATTLVSTATTPFQLTCTIGGHTVPGN